MLKNVSGEKGSAIVELALTLPLLSLLLIGSARSPRKTFKLLIEITVFGSHPGISPS